MDYFVPPERLETDGFVIRSYFPGDGGRIFDAVNASRPHLAPWMPWIDHHGTVEQSEWFARSSRGRFLLGQDFTLGIFSVDGTELLGGTGFHLREGPVSSLSAEIGMFIRASEAGKGLGTRALVALLDWGFREWPWIRLAWRCDIDNRPSVRTAERANMRREGTLRGQPKEVGEGTRDTACFAALRDEWSRVG
ncbi:MAG: GNAT family protein [Myxococcota bacterium]